MKAPLRRTFSEDFRRDAVRRAMEPGAILAHIGEELDIRASMLGRWVREHKEGKGTLPATVPKDSAQAKAAKSAPDDEVTRLRAEVARLTKERDRLKRTLAFYLEDGP